MQAIRLQQTIEKDGEIHLSNLPVFQGQQVDVVVSLSSLPETKKLLLRVNYWILAWLAYGKIVLILRIVRPTLVSCANNLKQNVIIFLDSDIIIDFLRRYPPAISWLESLEDEKIAWSGYVAMEL